MDVEAVGDALDEAGEKGKAGVPGEVLSAVPAAAGEVTNVSDAELGETGKPGTEDAANPACALHEEAPVHSCSCVRDAASDDCLSDLSASVRAQAFFDLFEHTSNAVILFDDKGEILAANSPAEHLFCTEAEHLTSRTIQSIFASEKGVAGAAAAVEPAAASAASAPARASADTADALPSVATSLDALSFFPGDEQLVSPGRVTVVCPDKEGKERELSVVCTRLVSNTCAQHALLSKADESCGFYLLIGRCLDPDQYMSANYNHVLGELGRANKRLAGTLQIVLRSLDAKDTNTLLARVLALISETMDATSSLCYLHEDNMLHLAGAYPSVADAGGAAGVSADAPSADNASTDTASASPSPHAHPAPALLSVGAEDALRALYFGSGKSLRLRILPTRRTSNFPSSNDLCEVLNVDTHEIFLIPRHLLPHFESFMSVPVWYGDEVIALIQVGYNTYRHMQKEDADLLDSVAKYLSLQLIGAISAEKAKRNHELNEFCTALREEMLSAPRLSEALLHRLCARAGHVLGAEVVFVHSKPDGASTAALAASAHAAANAAANAPAFIARGRAIADVPFPLLDFLPLRSLSNRLLITTFSLKDPLGLWLEKFGIMATGVLVDLGFVGKVRYGCVLYRLLDRPRFSAHEVDFIQHFAQNIRDISKSAHAQAQDRHIAQALQTGMSNVLQEVPGIRAQGIYSSATEAADVGGDFYDLVRLPGARACVIMGDVSGKGVEAASVSAAVKTALAAYAWQGLAPSAMVSLLNEFLLGFSRLETFATLFVGVCDLRAHTLKYCQAGHPPALLMRARTGDIVPLSVQSGVVGAFHDMRYVDGTAALEEGDVLMLYTDGTTEARAQDGSFFGEEGLCDALVREYNGRFDGLLARLLKTLDEFTAQNLKDDVAMVALQFCSDEACSDEACSDEAARGATRA